MLFKRCFVAPHGSFFLFGPRGTGKSTLLRQIKPDALWIDLLDPEAFRLYAARPERLLDAIRANPDRQDVVIDEIQRVPELLPAVHKLVEEKRGLRFILTGSSARKLRRAGVDMLAGRVLLRSLHPFIAAELGDAFSLEKALRMGMIPLVLASAHPEETLGSYATLYLKEEVQAEGFVRNVGNFSRFLEAVSYSHASVLNVSNIARECQVERKVVSSYLDILADLLLSSRISVFTRRAKRRLSRHEKLFLFDSGVFRSLRKTGPFDPVAELESPALEGLVHQHLAAWRAYRGEESSMHFWRTQSQVEVDFIIHGQKDIWAIEVKNSSTVHPKDLNGLKAFKQDYPECGTVLLYRGRERLLTQGILCLPCESFLAHLQPEKGLAECIAEA